MKLRFDRACAYLLTVPALSLSLLAQAPALRSIQPPGFVAAGAASPGVLAGATLYVSGQGGGVAKDAAGQMGEAMRKVQTVLRTAGMDFGNVVWMNVYLTDARQLAQLEDVYWKTIGPSPPARTVLMVAGLPEGEMVEINCIAVADTSRRKAIWPDGWPRGAGLDPPAIQAGELLYLSG